MCVSTRRPFGSVCQETVIGCGWTAADLLPGPPVAPSGAIGKSIISFGTIILGDHLSALLAFDCATPVEFAVAASDHLCPLLLYLQATVHTEPLTTPLLPLGCILAALQALPPLHAMETQAGVFDAVVRRVLQEDQIRGSNSTKGLVDGSPALCAVSCSHSLLVCLQLLRFIILGFQVVSNFSEICQLEPAGLDVAAPRYPMTLAGPLHGAFYSL